LAKICAPFFWALDRVDGQAKATETPMGFVPTPDALNLSGLNLSPETTQAILEVNAAEWADDLKDQRASLAKLATASPRNCARNRKPSPRESANNRS